MQKSCTMYLTNPLCHNHQRLALIPTPSPHIRMRRPSCAFNMDNHLTTQDYKTNTSSMQKTHFLLTSHIFNRALVGGLASTCKTTPPTRELSNNHVYTFTKYCRAVLDAELNSSSKVEEIWGLDQARFRKAFSTTDILKLGCLVDQVKAQKNRLYRFFVGFCKAFDIVLRERLL